MTDFSCRCQPVPFLLAALFLVGTALHAGTAAAVDRDHETMRSEQSPPECVILLHGLARTSRSMEKMAAALRQEDYHVINVDYPSRKHRIEELAATVIPKAIQDCGPGSTTIHFVAHSLGAIVVRYYLAHNSLPSLGRVVMLSPPNQGSEIVDRLINIPGFYWFHGPVGRQLGTDENSIPRQLPPVDYEVGVITGDRSINFFLSWIIPDADDGKVAVKRAKVAGMTDFLVTHHSHPFIMRVDDVIAQTIFFLRHGHFERSGESSAPKP